MSDVPKARRLTAASRAKIAELTAKGVPTSEAMAHAEWEIVDAIPAYGGSTFRDAFRDAALEGLRPVLLAEGFEGKGTTWRRTKGEVMQLVELQEGKGRDCTYVNLAIHLRFLETSTGRPATSPLEEPLHEFRKRLAPIGAQEWWYGRTAEEAGANARALVATLRERGLPFLARWGEFPGRFVAVTATDLRTWQRGLEATRDANVTPEGEDRVERTASPHFEWPVHVWPARVAMLLARMHTHLGRHEMAREFEAIHQELAAHLATSHRPPDANA